MDAEVEAFVAFSVFPGIGPVRFKLLREYFGSAKKAWEAPAGELRAIKLGDKRTSDFVLFRKTFHPKEYIQKLDREHVHVLTLDDPRYPARLKAISDAPFVLYVKAKPTREKLNLDRAIAVVGTRKITNYGTEVTKRIVSDLVSFGFTIVSGLAYGVDAAAHQAAIDSGGKTIAVLGSGIDIIAPSSNARLYHQIGDEGYGAIVSEMPLGLRPNKGLFPARNRIISGLSLGVVVTEGADDSGALITARNAAEQGREVFAVPGPITSLYSRGPAKLIKEGATLVESAEDVVEALGLSSRISTKTAGTTVADDLSREEAAVVSLLGDRRLTIDEIIQLGGTGAQKTGSILMMLEIKGIIKDFGGKLYGLA